MTRVEPDAVARIEDDLKARFAEVRRVEVLEYGENPAIEPGRVGIRVFIDPALTAEGVNNPLEAFHHTHNASIRELGRDLRGLDPAVSRLEFTDGNKSLFMMEPGRAEERAGDLTPVMTRLGRVDLETLDTLISAGIAASRAEGVRWALARIRERPAYEQLRARGREIEELKTQF